MRHHYAFEAVRLLQQSIEQLQAVIEHDEQSSKAVHHHVSTSSLYDLKEALVQAERALYHFFVILVEDEQALTRGGGSAENLLLPDNCCLDLASTVATLQSMIVLDEQRHGRQASHGSVSAQHTSDPHVYYTSRSVTDALLFRLIVVLQLCLVRIEDARLVICGSRFGWPTRTATLGCLGHWGIPTLLNCVAGSFGLAASAQVLRGHRPHMLTMGDWMEGRLAANRGWILPVAKASVGLVVAQWVHRKWNQMWTSTRLTNSTESLEAWCRKWELFMDHKTRARPRSRSPILDEPERQQQRSEESAAVDSARNQRLIEYALNETPKTAFWHSQGELRFWMIKRAMDVFYASVGTAIDITGQDSKENHNENAMWQVPLVTAAVASFYSVTGARDRVVEVTSSSRSAQRLIKEAWGMVSLPSVKNLSLQASRLLKGAAVADRIEICGIPCFVLSREPAPELAAAIKRNRRMHQRRKPIATLSTIDELEEEESSSNHTSSCCRRPFARSSGTRYRQRDVIFHLTGGGFFAHIIASDLPYLLDWSAKTGAVVICPEYALLPEHAFPFALHQVERVYQALVSDEAVTALGFETNTIVVTGESAGGNLAAALCVKIGTAATTAVDDDAVLISSGSPPIETTTTKTKRVPMPDALMLSCPVLNLSLELSLSRVAGTNDPVLPSGLLTAISDAYLPPELGIGKREPLASPLFASDQVLSHFPPTLLFASSQDPVLDDAVVFNQRLRSLGVDSDLFAANNMPHAYLGLGTAGFPEAQQVQQLCVNWLNRQLANEPSREDGSSRYLDGGS